MDTCFFDQYQRQINDWQRRFFETWRDSIPGGENQVSLSETIDKVISLQQELMNTTLKAQEVTTQVAMESQKQIWENYFDLVRKTRSQTSQTRSS